MILLSYSVLQFQYDHLYFRWFIMIYLIICISRNYFASVGFLFCFYWHSNCDWRNVENLSLCHKDNSQIYLYILKKSVSGLILTFCGHDFYLLNHQSRAFFLTPFFPARLYSFSPTREIKSNIHSLSAKCWWGPI